MLAWSHLQVIILYVRSLLSHGLPAVAKQQGFSCIFKSSFTEETPFSCLQAHYQDCIKKNLDLLNWPPLFSVMWMRPTDVDMKFLVDSMTNVWGRNPMDWCLQKTLIPSSPVHVWICSISDVLLGFNCGQNGPHSKKLIHEILKLSVASGLLYPIKIPEIIL